MAPVRRGLIERLRDFVVRALAMAYPFLPETIRRPLLDALGALLPMGDGSRRVVESNLVTAYPGGIPARRDLRENLFASARVRRLRLEVEAAAGWRDDRAILKGLAHWEALPEEGRMTALLVVGELGSPELALRRLARAGIGARNAVRFVGEEAARPSATVRIPAFGVPTPVSTVPAEYARETGAAIVPVVSYRSPRTGEFTVEILPELGWVAMPAEPELEIAVNTARLAGLFEEKARAYPADWPWWRERFAAGGEPLRDGEWRRPARPMG